MILFLPLIVATIAFTEPLPDAVDGPPPPDVALHEPVVAWPHASLDAPPRLAPPDVAGHRASVP